jgi:hypothetical protein
VGGRVIGTREGLGRVRATELLGVNTVDFVNVPSYVSHRDTTQIRKQMNICIL